MHFSQCQNKTLWLQQCSHKWADSKWKWFPLPSIPIHLHLDGKKEQGYLDNCGPNWGAMVKCLAIKQFQFCLNDPDHQKWPFSSIYDPKKWCCVYCNMLSYYQWFSHQRSSSVPPVSIQTKCHCLQCKIPTCSHKSSCSVIVYHWSRALMGWPFRFEWKKKKCRPLGWSLNFLPLFHFMLLFLKFVSHVDWQSEGFQKAAVDLIYHQQPDLIRSMVRDKSCSEWLMSQTKDSRTEGSWAEQSWSTKSNINKLSNKCWDRLKQHKSIFPISTKDQKTMHNVKGVYCSDEPRGKYHTTLRFPWAVKSVLLSLHSLFFFYNLNGWFSALLFVNKKHCTLPV